VRSLLALLLVCDFSHLVARDGRVQEPGARADQAAQALGSIGE
jgi:hypothetical protein